MQDSLIESPSWMCPDERASEEVHGEGEEGLGDQLDLALSAESLHAEAYIY